MFRKCLNLFFQKEYLMWQKTLMLGKIEGGRRGQQRMTGGLACCSPRRRKSWTQLDDWRTTAATTSHASFTMSDQVLLHTHKKWFVAPAWTCSFHQDEGLDDTGWPWLENALQSAGMCPRHGVLASYQFIYLLKKIFFTNLFFTHSFSDSHSIVHFVL